MKSDRKTERPTDERRPLVEHLEELRVRAWWCLATIAAGATLTYTVHERLLAWLVAPVGHVVFTGLTEPLMATLKLAAWGGVLLGFPMILWQAWEFLAVGLRDHERRAIGRLLPLGIVLFFSGAWLALTKLTPMVVRFFLNLAGDSMAPMLSVSRYLGFVGSMMLACGLIAQTPLVLAALAHLGIVTPAFLWHHWRGAVVGSFIAAAVVTPTPDIFTQGVLATLLLVLYGISIGLAALMPPRRQTWPVADRLGKV